MVVVRGETRQVKPYSALHSLEPDISSCRTPTEPAHPYHSEMGQIRSSPAIDPEHPFLLGMSGQMRSLMYSSQP